MKKLLRSALAKIGLATDRFAEQDRITALIRRLHPLLGETPLIRIGASGDGGYLVPDDLEGLAACFSPGVDKVASFEEGLLARGIPCFMIDASVEGAPVDSPLTRFDKKFLGVVNDNLYWTLDSWVERYAPGNDDLILQMDIEGGEWQVLLNATEQTLRRFRILVIELHDLDRMIARSTFPFLEQSLDRLLRHFSVVHLHPNNNIAPFRRGGLTIPRLLEVTLVRNDRLTATRYSANFPHPLDSPNVPGRADIPLPSMWYSCESANG